MKRIKVNYVDFHPAFDINKDEFMIALRQRYEVEISDHPDFLFYSMFGQDHLKYDCVRIFYTGEAFVPDFNQCDYAIGFDRLVLGDRYLRAPIYLLNEFKPNYQALLTRREVTMEELKQRKFCSFVVSNCFADDIRTKILDKVNEYRTVDSGGRYRNNIGGAVKDKTAFQQNYRFSIAFENCSYRGYTTEKIVDAFAVYTIPIYYGDPDVILDFNEEAFINCHRYKDFDEVLDVIKEIDNNDELALKMLNADPLVTRQDPDLVRPFLYHIFDQEPEEARRRPVSMYTKAQQERILRHNFFEKNIYKYWKKGKNEVVRLKTGTRLTSRRTK